MSALLQAWLVAWLFALGVSLGAMANLMVLALTSRTWAAPAIPAWIAAARVLPWVALGFIPVAAGNAAIYPWAAHPTAWLNPIGFVLRGIAYLVAWIVLSRGFLRAFESGSPRTCCRPRGSSSPRSREPSMDDLHEPSHVDLRRIGVAAGVVAGGIALAVTVPWLIVANAPSPANAPNNAEKPRIAGAVQPTAPRLVREAYEREKGRP